MYTQDIDERGITFPKELNEKIETICVEISGHILPELSLAEQGSLQSINLQILPVEGRLGYRIMLELGE